MTSIFETKAFDTEILLKSYYNFFPEDVRTANEVFEVLKIKFDQELLPAFEFEDRTIYIHRFDITGDWITLLFHMTDPNVRDRDYSNVKNGTLRTAERRQGESPAFSALVVVNKSSLHDTTRTYPFIIQEAQSLSKSIITKVVNQYIGIFSMRKGFGLNMATTSLLA